MAAPSNSRLFDEMDKFDDSNGRLNLTDLRTTPVKDNLKSESHSTDGDDRIRLDLSAESKKKLGRKITDYFSKKSI